MSNVPPLARTLLAVAVLALGGVLADVAASETVLPPQASFTIDSVHLNSPMRLTLSGTVTCTQRAHYHLNAWVEQQDRGALAKGSLPPKLARPTKAAIDRWRAATLCKAANQPWSIPVDAVGKHPIGFTAGPVTACVVMYVGKSHLYTLGESCRKITVG